MPITEPTRRREGFVQDEDGSLILFSLFVTLAMLLATGLAIDLARTEVARTKLQNTLDRAVLAAADLDQTRTPEAVVEDYFERAELSAFLGDVDVNDGLNFRTVSAETELELPTRFLRMIGIDTLPTPASGTANETITDVEISLVLDNSGSMASNNRLNLLKAAAKDFVDIVVNEGLEEQKVSINVVPFSTQVSAGPDLLQFYNVTSEHTFSHCVDFAASHFTTASLSRTSQMQRTGHFDVFSWANPLEEEYLVCPTDPNRHIRVLAHDRASLKAKIDSMWAGGNTSIDVATKWGLTLLDPGSRSVVSGLIAQGKVSADFEGRPFDYTEPQVLKVLVVMSDGENTSQFMLRDQFRSGLSPLWVDPATGRETYFHNRANTTSDYYYFHGGNWRTSPFPSLSAAQRMTWQQVWASRSVAWYARYNQAAAIGGSWSTHYNSYYTSVTPSTKNTRTAQICAAAKAQGITVYTIGMDTYGLGDATLSNCATSPAYFFDVDGLEIGDAFSAIARDINRLRLTQ